jgi:hypothetical protein
MYVFHVSELQVSSQIHTPAVLFQLFIIIGLTNFNRLRFRFVPQVSVSWLHYTDIISQHTDRNISSVMSRHVKYSI